MKLYTFLFKKYKFGAYKFVCIYIQCSVLYFVCTALVASHTDKEPCTTSGCFPFLHWLPASTMAAVCRQGFAPFGCFMCRSDALSSWVWLLWLRVMFPVLPTTFLSMGGQYCVLLMSQTLFVHFSVDGRERFLLWSCCEPCCCEYRWCCVDMWLSLVY